MAKYSVCVVDDVLEHAEACAGFLRYIPEIGEIHVITRPFDVISTLKSYTIDILFMDIEMPEVSGIDIYKSIPEAIRPPLVLVTRHTSFAREAFNIAAADYVVKPVDYLSISAAVVKALRLVNGALTVYNLPERDYCFYPVKGGGLEMLNFGDTICIEGDGNYTVAHLRGGTQMLLRKRMYQMAEDVPTSYFVRIHQSYIVNIRFAGKLIRNGKALFVKEFAESEPLPVSRAYRAALLSRAKL